MAEEKKEEKKGLLGMLGFGAAKKAGKELSGRTSKIDTEVDKAVSGEPDEHVKGKDAGELGKPYKDTFRF